MQHGFTLIEMAVVLVIIALALGGVLMPLSTQVEQRQIGETERVSEEIKEALIGFAIVNGRLPCPDTDNDGRADPIAAGACPQRFGNVPWQTLGVSAFDAWGNRFRYQVSNASSGAYTTAIALPPTISAPDLQVCVSASGVTSTDCGTSANTLVAQAPVVFYSLGKNGARWLTGGDAPVSANEQENANLVSNTNLVFVSRVKTGADSPVGEFDDIVTWLSPNVLFNRLVAAGKLP